jgi:L-ascorbate metabolism protein UlaG (beta-lactamase superfamily)
MEDTTTISYIGHSTVLIELDGLRLMTDPLLRNQVTFLIRTAPITDHSIVENIDVVLISHLHYDHLDFGSLRMLGDQIRLIVPRGASEYIKKHGFHNLEELPIGESLNVGSLSIQATYTAHVRSRHPFGPEADCQGYIISGSSKIYYPGDTRFFPEMAEVADDVDLALLPVWGWGIHLGKDHMNPRQAAEALSLIQPRIAIPIHWGTMMPIGLRWLKPGFYYFPPIDFAQHAAKLAPEVSVQILMPGEKMEFNNSSGKKSNSQ